MIDDELLRTAYAVHLRRDADRVEASVCPSPEALLALVRREGAEADRLAVLDHVMSCAHCRAEFDLLRAVLALEPDATRGTDAAVTEGAATDAAATDVAGTDRRTSLAVRRLRPARAHRRWPAATGLLLAASLVLMVGVRRLRTHAGPASPDVVRGEGDDVTLVAPARGTTVTLGTPIRFVWRAVRGATRYTVEVLAPDGTAVVAATSADTVFDARGGGPLVSGVAYGWWVRALAMDGRVVQRSAVRELRVAPP